MSDKTTIMGGMLDHDIFYGVGKISVIKVKQVKQWIMLHAEHSQEHGDIHLDPQTARDLAAHLVALADKLEGKADV